MINRNATIRWKGYDPNDLTKGSHKRVWVNCIDCGDGRWVQFNAVHDRCNSCAQLLNKSLISEDVRMNMSAGQKKRFEDPNEIELNRLRAIKQFESVEAREIQRKNSLEQWSHQEARDEMSKIKLQYYIDHPEGKELNRQRQIQYIIDNPEARKRLSDQAIKQFSDPKAREVQRRNSLVQWSNIEACEKMSAIKQGISYDEWEGFYQADWRNWRDTILLNDPFPGCHRHHITETLAICIPKELHNHVRHVLKAGENMGEINMLAFQFINGGL